MTYRLQLVLFFISAFFYLSNSYSPSDILNPKDNPKRCGRSKVAHSSICDPDNYLSEEKGNIIEGRINEISTAEVALLVIKKMDYMYIGFQGAEEAARKFAMNIHDKWGVGDKTTNNGVLLFLSIEDRVLFISTGAGVEHQLTSRALDVTINNMRTYLRRKEYFEAMDYAILDIASLLSSKARPPPPVVDSTSFVLFVVCFSSLLALFGIINYRKHVWKNGMTRGSQKLNDLMKEIQLASEDNKYETTSCPICLENFPLSSPTNELETNQPLLPKAANRPMALQCGHVFCFTCLDTHLKSANGKSCPICRRPADGTVRGSPNTARCSPADSSDATALRTSDLLYRVDRMSYLYPQVMNAQTRRSMLSAIETGDTSGVLAAAQSRLNSVKVIMADAAKAEAAARSGSSGSSSSSFGGGRSSGGRGGGW